jgi:hypothetical protein
VDDPDWSPHCAAAAGDEEGTTRVAEAVRSAIDTMIADYLRSGDRFSSAEMLSLPYVIFVRRCQFGYNDVPRRPFMIDIGHTIGTTR